MISEEYISSTKTSPDFDFLTLFNVNFVVFIYFIVSKIDDGPVNVTLFGSKIILFFNLYICSNDTLDISLTGTVLLFLSLNDKLILDGFTSII